MQHMVRRLVCLATVAGLSFGASAKSVDLPFGYRQIEWIEGAGSQWIDAGVDTYPGTMQTECVFTPSADYEGEYDIFGGRNWQYGYWLRLTAGGLSTLR